MKAKVKSESDKQRKHEETDDTLERELEDSFPASDPPSSSQPTKSGAPDHKREKPKA